MRVISTRLMPRVCGSIARSRRLGLKFGCGFMRHLFHQGSPASGSVAIFETGSKATTTPVAPAVARVFAFSMQAEQSIVVDPKSPGGINSPHGLILFDGVCVLCSRGCRFVSKRDPRLFSLRSDPVGRGTSAR